MIQIFFSSKRMLEPEKKEKIGKIKAYSFLFSLNLRLGSLWVLTERKE